jgi:hypothetical protein
LTVIAVPGCTVKWILSQLRAAASLSETLREKSGDIILPVNIPGGCGGLQTPAHLFFIKNLRAIARSDPP